MIYEDTTDALMGVEYNPAEECIKLSYGKESFSHVDVALYSDGGFGFRISRYHYMNMLSCVTVKRSYRQRFEYIFKTGCHEQFRKKRYVNLMDIFNRGVPI